MPSIRTVHDSTKLQQRIVKQLRQSPKTPTHIGLDVHKDSIHVAIHHNGGLLADWRTSANYAALADQLLPLLPFTKSVAYEAGPTGFSLARTLQRHGFDVIVCAPGHTPQASARQNKSDRIDAGKLARFSALGLLKAVTIPSEQEEQERLVLRHRNALVSKLSRVKIQIKSELLFTGAGELRSWNKEELKRLAELPCAEEQRFALDSLLREMELLESELKATTMRVQHIMSERHAEAKAILESHPGVGPVTAAAFALELFRPERFRNSRAVVRFLGLAPGLAQTGNSNRPQPLMKTGQARLRSQLVEAAWRWIRIDPIGRSVYGRLVHNTGNAKKAIVGMARRLAVRLWTLLIRGEKYNPAKAKNSPTPAQDRQCVEKRTTRRKTARAAKMVTATKKSKAAEMV
jgi:transposase